DTLADYHDADPSDERPGSGTYPVDLSSGADIPGEGVCDAAAGGDRCDRFAAVVEVDAQHCRTIGGKPFRERAPDSLRGASHHGVPAHRQPTSPFVSSTNSPHWVSPSVRDK